ncbi:MAG: COX15/CtaA family protein [Balneolaceae bacterium]|nr:COX15/CtaA family protein [Balneolaceae bacterium]
MKLNTYQKTAITTVGATIFLIFVGGLVRASGAGLGCPDWPKCFGSWIPPTSVADLPAGFDASQFNVVKTWTEYINRLIGVIIGLLITATFLLSFRYRKSKPSVTFSSGAAFVMVLVQGWLGGQVVKSGLSEWLITIHMVLAMAIMTTLLYAAYKATENRWNVNLDPFAQRWLFGIGLLLFVLTMIQLVLGTEVREAVDKVSRGVAPLPREMWLANIGSIDEIHRTFSWAVLLSGIGLLYVGLKRTESSIIQKLSIGIMVFIGLQIILGVGLYYLDMPPAFQVLHLVGVAFLISFEFMFLLMVRPKNQAILWSS